MDITLEAIKQLKAQEEWRVIPSASNYAASNQGCIVRTGDYTKGCRGRVGKVLQPSIDSNGYRVVNIGGRHTRKVCCLVAEAWMGTKPSGFDVHHRDGEKENDWSDNLMYISHWAHGQAHGKAAKHAVFEVNL